MSRMKVLNLYSGIGGNRKLWIDVEVTAIENNLGIAKIYQDFFPDDKVVITDAHQYLLEHYKEFDFIWSSPPCSTHCRMENINHSRCGVRYPNMELYQEIILLHYRCKGKYCIENVISYYKPLIRPQELQRHYFWANFWVKPLRGKPDYIRTASNEYREQNNGFDLSDYKGIDKTKILRNCVLPELGLHIFNSMNNKELNQFKLAL